MAPTFCGGHLRRLPRSMHLRNVSRRAQSTLCSFSGKSSSGSGAVACTAAEPSTMLVLVQHVANSYEFVHTATGLPWAASIPLTTLALRLALLPLSMRQARIIRSNFSLYREAVALTDQQERERHHQQQQQGQGQGHGQHGQEYHGQQQHQDHNHPGPGVAATTSTVAAGAGATVEVDPGLPSVLHSRMLRSQAVLSNFDKLRRKIPVFVLVSATLGIMSRLPWPGLSSEGALWFPDLTLPAVVMETGEMPMGPAGLVLPLLVYGMTMTSLRLGFGASGLAGKQQQLQLLQQPQTPGGAAPSGEPPDTTLAAFLRSLAPLLYVLTTLNLYFKVQMAHGVLVHWLGSAGFTLSLQLALRNPALRALFLRFRNLPSSSAGSLSGASPSLAPSPSSSTSPSVDSANSGGSGSSSPPHPSLDSTRHLPSDLVARVDETTDPNVLVIMGAQLSARQHYAGALHCFRKAVLLNPGHVRAHYSMGQVFALTGRWSDAEVSYRAAAELSAPSPERGQALYCVATALHSQAGSERACREGKGKGDRCSGEGKLEAAAAAYADADANWPGQTVIVYGRANALAAAGQREAAAEALAEAEARDAATPGRPFHAALARLRTRLTAAATEEGEGGGGVARHGQGGSGPGSGSGPGGSQRGTPP
ncbi:hypothetical protein VOLCADRAFT_108139 [Volvox carteri f. nagariensis]|uniref:Uncharacterized protein n=1 Tax=Volvox carteri f. nagariensis TaxID=3068 RepID=D8UIH5_VOLCA|nr:uncharacterized protein VOLCADRAFT_108139 [Volvox carteri f. nagariensis]EFJ40476.1 hypothetical protein VOLCADRAFT_108139 [Volvox carteri f. nagariensis]|eukprot:XP_002958476.1 hypothetical protein VOLCADRAFT_108139 [Volvox carteri f. nagariensis]